MSRKGPAALSLRHPARLPRDPAGSGFPKVLQLAAFTAGVADTLMTVYLPLHLHRDLHEKHLFVIGLMIALPQLGVLAASNLWGAAGDRWRRLKPLVLIGLAGYAAMMVALALSRESSRALAVAFLGALFYSAYKPGALAYVTLREPERKGHALGWLMRMQSLGWFLGNLACGALLVRYGPGGMALSLYMTAGVALVALVMIAIGMPEIGRHEFEARLSGGPAPGFLEDLAQIYRTPALFWLAVVWFLCTAGRWLFYNFLPILLTDFFRGPVTWVSAASAWSAFGGILLFGMAGGWVDRWGPGVVLRAAVAAYLVYFAINVVLTYLYGRGPSPVYGLLVAALFVIPIYPAFVVAGNAWVASVLHRSQRSGGLGAIGGVEAAGAMGGALLGGVLGDRMGLRVAPAASTALALAATVVAFAALRLPGSGTQGRQPGTRANLPGVE